MQTNAFWSDAAIIYTYVALLVFFLLVNVWQVKRFNKEEKELKADTIEFLQLLREWLKQDFKQS